MTETIYKLTITAKYTFSDSYIISTDEVSLPSMESCLGFIESCTKSGKYIDITVENVEIERMKVCDNATI